MEERMEGRMAGICVQQRRHHARGLLACLLTHLLLRPAVEPARVALPLAEPPPQQLLVRLRVQRVADGKRAHAGEDLARVRLGARHAAEAAVEVAAAVVSFVWVVGSVWKKGGECSCMQALNGR